MSKKRAALMFKSKMTEHMEAGSFKALAEIHRFMFEEIYEFAGEIRKVNLSKGNFRFAPVMYLQSTIESIEKMPQSSFDEIIEKYIEMV